MATFDPGRRLGPYSIISRLGAGGMGEVWRATDTRLNRQVAIKILPPEFAHNAQLKLRFEREAKTISQLNHPHICTVHDVGDENGTQYLVMELLEGDTLADRLTKGPLQVDQALRYGIEIASALDRAHREGIVHRDLKPANIVLTKSGAKLLDFGLAKSGLVPVGGAATDTATQQKPLTEEGAIVGTFQYMAPEQVTGEAVDPRTDIFAFGAVLYEMLTGTPAFVGKSRTSIVAAIISGEPQPIASMAPLTPPALEHVVKTCLAKDPDDRWQAARDVMLQLEWINEEGSPVAVAQGRRPRQRMAWWAAAAAAIVAVAFAGAYLRLLGMPKAVLQTSIEPPPKAKLLAGSENSGAITISPDGRMVTFAAQSDGGKPMLWLRPLDSASARPLAGTEDGTYPFWSPDSRNIAFFSGHKLKRIDLSDSPPITICDAPINPRGGSWNQNGTIIFSPLSIGPLFQVSALGGRAMPLTALNVAAGESTHRFATFLPDGRHFLFAVGSHSGGTKSDANAIDLSSLDNGNARTLLLRVRSNVAYASGYLLYVRDRVLIAQPFDAAKFRFTGDPIPVVQNVRYETNAFRAQFAVSDDGVLVYQPSTGTDVATLQLFDRSGKPLQTIGEPAQFEGCAVSPDGSRLALTIQDLESGISRIWIHDLARNVRTPFTSGDQIQGSPIWSPDGSRIAYGGVTTRTSQDIMVKDTSGEGREQVLVADRTVKDPTDWSRDGRYLAYTSTDYTGKARGDIWILPLFGDRKPIPFIRTAFNENSAMFSPDTRWLAYVSDESGRPEVYLVPFPALGRKWQISSTGAMRVHWRADGREVLIQELDGTVATVPIAIAGSSVTIGTPQPLFNISGAVAADTFSKDLHLVVASRTASVPEQSINVVTNWPATIRR